MTTTQTFTFRYIECDIPAGLTVSDYRRTKPSSPSRFSKFALSLTACLSLDADRRR